MPTEKTTIVCHVCDEDKPSSHFLPGHKICVSCEQDAYLLNYTKRTKAGEQYPQARRNCENCDD